VPHNSPQTFLREFDTEVRTAADKNGGQASRLFLQDGKVTGKKPMLLTSTGKLIDDALKAVEKENPKLKNVPVASVYDRRTLKSRVDRRQPREFRTNRRRTNPRKTSDGRRPMLQLQIDPANPAGLIGLIATIPVPCSRAVSASHKSAAVTDRRSIAKGILGHAPKSSHSNPSSAFLGDLRAFAVKKSSIPNFDWVQHMLQNLSRHSAAATDFAPNGSMALLLANGSMSSNSSGEGDIRIHHYSLLHQSAHASLAA
jgi:hypothetical protein